MNGNGIRITKHHIRNASLTAAISGVVVFLSAVLQSLGADGAQESFGSLRDFIPLLVAGGSAVIAAERHNSIIADATAEQAQGKDAQIVELAQRIEELEKDANPSSTE